MTKSFIIFILIVFLLYRFQIHVLSFCASTTRNFILGRGLVCIEIYEYIQFFLLLILPGECIAMERKQKRIIGERYSLRFITLGETLDRYFS